MGSPDAGADAATRTRAQRTCAPPTSRRSSWASPGSNMRVTRMRSDISHAAMTKDFVLRASTDQSEVSNIRNVTQSVNLVCPSYGSCGSGGNGGSPTGTAGGPGAEADASLNGTTTARAAPAPAARLPQGAAPSRTVAMAAAAWLRRSRARDRRRASAPSPRCSVLRLLESEGALRAAGPRDARRNSPACGGGSSGGVAVRVLGRHDGLLGRYVRSNAVRIGLSERHSAFATSSLFVRPAEMALDFGELGSGCSNCRSESRQLNAPGAACGTEGVLSTGPASRTSTTT